jgi:hypothetical protein
MPAAARTGAALATITAERLPTYKRRVLTCYLMFFLSVQNRSRTLCGGQKQKNPVFFKLPLYNIKKIVYNKYCIF